MRSSETNERLWQGDMPEIRGPWLGQPGPANMPKEFCPEIFSTARRPNIIAGVAFVPEGDEVFFTMNTPTGESSNLMQTRLHKGVWTRPRAVPFDSEQIDNDICISPDGKRLCWRSWRPLPGNAAPEKRPSLWAVDRCADGWGEPFPVKCGGEIQMAWYPSIAANGSLYFSARATPDEYRIYLARRKGNAYEAREPVICGMQSGGDLCIAPDESFLVVTCFEGPHFKGRGNQHVSFRTTAGDWTPLRNIGPVVNTELTEYCPTISADGTRLFFCRLDWDARRASTYWIDASVIEALRPTA